MDNYKYKKSAEYINRPVTDRLLQLKVDQDANLKKAQEAKLKETIIDSKTGQKFYKPKIIRGPKEPKNPSKPVQERLYKDERIVTGKAEAEKRAKQHWEKVKAKTYSMQHSEKMLVAARKKKSKELFELLDPDSCGTINSSHIKLDYLSSKALEMLEPILINMENKKLSLNYDAFHTIMDPYLKKLSMTQLREIVAGPKKDLDEEMRKNLTFAVSPLNKH